MKKSSAILACLLLTGACSKVKELDKRTESMEKSTEKVSAVTDEMKNTATTMYLQIRSGDSLKVRNEAYSLLLNEDSAIRTKVTAACMYLKGFEYQLWTDNSSYDDFHARSVMYTDAANEFTRRVGDLYDLINPEKLSPVKQGKKDNDEMAFYALAVSLHMNHHFQNEIVRQKSHLQTNSMYDMIKKALLKDMRGQYLEEHEEILVNGMNKEIAIELIKARVDILAALALTNLTDKRDMTLGQKAKGLLFKVTGGRLGGIELPENFDKSNNATKNHTENYLEGSFQAKKFLKEIGVEKDLEKTIKSAFKNIDFNEKNQTEDEKAIKDPKKEKIRSLINNLIK